ncbi:MAG TPA: hypothetical protein VE866_06345 [Candidatus Binatia bacterium]|nr:hypothetical protein [Candidatus Binatia bacterium]
MIRKCPVFAVICCSASVVGLALLMIGCGSSKSMNNNLTPAQAQSVATAVSSGIVQAITAGLGAGVIDPLASGMHRVDPVPNTSLPNCVSSGSGESCTWPISSTFSCPGGGTMAVSGDSSGTLSSTGNGSAQAQITADPASCSVNGIVLNGNPSVTVAGQINIANDAPVWPVTGSETGGVTFGPNPSGSCQFNLTFTVNANLSCTVTGTACGQTVSGSC